VLSHRFQRQACDLRRLKTSHLNARLDRWTGALGVAPPWCYVVPRPQFGAGQTRVAAQQHELPALLPVGNHAVGRTRPRLRLPHRARLRAEHRAERGDRRRERDERSTGRALASGHQLAGVGRDPR